jgi:hypothetical protein
MLNRSWEIGKIASSLAEWPSLFWECGEVMIGAQNVTRRQEAGGVVEMA